MALPTFGRGMIRNFESQFEVSGDGEYLYRLNGKGKPIPVNRLERSRFIAQYVSRALLVQAIMMAAGTAFFFAFLYKAVASAKATPGREILSDPMFYAGTAAILLPAWALLRWVWGAPARALAERASVGEARTTDEMRALAFRRMTYSRLAFVAAIGVGSFDYIADGYWDRQWAFVPPLLVSVAAVQAFRKWRFERRHPGII